MAKIDAANLAPDAYPRVKGTIITRATKFGLVVQKWPAKRGPSKTWQQRWLTEQFAIASRFAANSEPMQWETVKFMSQGTVWLPRDLLVMAAYGKLYELRAPDGTMYTQADHSPPPDPDSLYWADTATCSFNGNDNTWGNFTLRQRILNSALTNVSGALATRVTFAASTTMAATLVAAYIGHQAGSGDPYDFAAAPVQLKFGGAAGVAIMPGSTATSDDAMFIPDGVNNIVISAFWQTSSGLRDQTVKAGWSAYYKSGNDASTVNASGYTTNGRPAVGIASIQTQHTH